MAATSAGVSGFCIRLALGTMLVIGMSIPARAMGGETPFNPMSDGSDGALVVNQSTVINLALAPTGSWMDPAPQPGLGVYDPSIWAVVFKYESVSINAGTVSFLNHPSGAPVVWLVEGDVVVAAGTTVNLNGSVYGGESAYAPGGPGGFTGGRATSAGFGPGGGAINASGTGEGGRYADGLNSYGNLDVRPLMGGSGGAGNKGAAPANQARSGAGGGGAILIGADTIAVLGVITARGGNGANWPGAGDSGAGSGGAVRLVGNSVTVIGLNRLIVTGGTSDGGVTSGGSGRMRIEAFAMNIEAGAALPGGFPHYTTARPGPLFQDNTTPGLRVAALNGTPVSDDPLGGVQSIDVGINDTASTLFVAIEAWNVEPGSIIEVKVFQAQGNPLVFQSSPLVGNIKFSTATAEIMLNSGIPGDIVLRVLP